jgi:hypothetical protein
MEQVNVLQLSNTTPTSFPRLFDVVMALSVRLLGADLFQLIQLNVNNIYVNTAFINSVFLFSPFVNSIFVRPSASPLPLPSSPLLPHRFH